MDCSLCFEINKSGQNSITYNSAEWQELNIQYIIEKYFWKMENLNVNSYICQTCWQELYNFHTFYLKIEKAHTNLKMLINSDVAPDDDSNETGEIFQQVYIEDQNCSTEINKIDTNKNRSDIDNKIDEYNKSQNEIDEEMDDLLNDEDDENYKSYDSDDSSSNSVDAYKLEQLHQEQDKFIGENLQITCSICNIALVTFDIMIKHYKEEHNQCGYATCCDRKLYTRAEIVDHINLHKNPEYFKCKRCGKLLNSRNCLHVHIKRIHEQKRVKCNICHKSMANESSLRTHKLLHDADNKETKIQCKQCDKSFLHEHSLANHMRLVHLNQHITCGICDKSIKDNYTFKRHMLEHEGKQKSKVACEICGRILSDLPCLKRHMCSNHPPYGVKREFKCTECTKIFTSNSNLKGHIRTVHEKKYVRNCTLCEKSFSGPGALKDHMSHHIGKPLLACGFCPREFYSNGNMHAHRKRAHPKEWKESFQKKYYRQSAEEKESLAKGYEFATALTLYHIPSFNSLLIKIDAILKQENLNNNSFICQVCWQALYNFHNFYLKIETAHNNLKILINTEVFSDDSSEKGELSEQIVIDCGENSQLEPETLFITEEIPLESFEKEDVEEVNNLNKASKRTYSLRNSGNNKQSIETDHLEVKCKKEIKEVECNIKRDEIALKFADVENNCGETNVDLNCNGSSYNFESDYDSSSNSFDATKLEQLHHEQDKFIGENLQITCSVCDIPLPTCDTMIKHYKEEHNQRGYATCCDKKLYNRSEIVDHIKLHKNPEYFKCKQCDRILNSRNCLQMHIKNVHGNKQFKCSICFKILSHASSLRTHKLIHEADNGEKISCKECDKVFRRKHSLSNHMRIVHLKRHIICDLCGKSIKDNYTFKRHMLEHEGKEKSKVTCEVCGRILSDVPCLKRHMRSNHPPDGVKREFKCTECTKIFTSNSNLKGHIRTVHEKKYVRNCTLCEKSFSGPGALKDHMSHHIGKPLLACGFCPREFYSNGNMHAHRKKAHPKEWKESFQKKYYRQSTVEKE